jgi:hypothetical protein
MYGKEIKAKFPYVFYGCGNSMEDCYDVIQIFEPHEAGEIINHNQLICNVGSIGDLVDKGKYKTGDWVKIVDISSLDVFDSDMDMQVDNFTKYNKHNYYRYIRN